METSKVRDAITVVLRVPSIFLLHKVLKEEDTEWSTMTVYFIIVVIQLFDLMKVAKIYQLMVGCALVAVSAVAAEISIGFSDVPLLLFGSLCLQVVLSFGITFLLELPQKNMVYFMPYTLPILCSIASFPEDVTSFLLYAANVYSVIILLLLPVMNWREVYEWFSTEISNVLAIVGHGDVIRVFWAIWQENKVGLQLVTFWLGYLASDVMEEKGNPNHPSQPWYLTLLESSAYCCDSVLALAGMSLTMTYACSAVLWSVTAFLHWRIRDIFLRNEVDDGTTQGYVTFVLAIQMGLSGLVEFEMRVVVVCILLFHLVTSLLASLQELTDSVLLTAAASQMPEKWKHIRCISLCLIFVVLPLWMTYGVLSIFSPDAWTLICLSSCVMTAVQSFGSLVIYSLFMYDQWREEPWDNLDDAVFYARSSLRVIDFFVAAVCLVLGVYRCFTDDVSYMTIVFLVLHTYFNVWTNLQRGWKTFLRRRQAASRVDHLPMASPEELAARNDLCSICYQRMTSARVTRCGHCFHAACLKKWMYVQTFCPMCHAEVSLAPGSSPPTTTTREDEVVDEAEGQGAGDGAKGDEEVVNGGVAADGESVGTPGEDSWASGKDGGVSGSDTNVATKGGESDSSCDTSNVATKGSETDSSWECEHETFIGAFPGATSCDSKAPEKDISSHVVFSDVDVKSVYTQREEEDCLVQESGGSCTNGGGIGGASEESVTSAQHLIQDTDGVDDECVETAGNVINPSHLLYRDPPLD